jgi:predicted alpha/beta superfamily hydrolase
MQLRPLRLLTRALLGVLLLVGTTWAGEAVTFRTQQTTSWGESVYVLGDHPALGGGDPTRALRMVPGSQGSWSLQVELPGGTSYSYQYLIRWNDAGSVEDGGNARTVSGVERGRTGGQSQGFTGHGVQLRYYSGWSAPVLRYLDGGQVRQANFRRIGDGRGNGESLHEVTVTLSDERLVFVVDDGQGNTDRPHGGGVYQAPLGTVTLQDGRVSGGAGSTAGPGGRSRFEEFQWWSNTLSNQRPVTVYLPAGYDADAGRRYPVLYMHDGQNLFGADAMFGGWRVGQTADRLIAEGSVEPVIVIGIGNTSGRMQEYIPPQDGGRAQDYARFLIDELKPWVDGRYRTRSDAEHTAVAGSSLGGLVSLYLAWEHPDVFGRAASLSGSFWLENWANGLATDQPPSGLRLYLDSGTAGASGDSMQYTYGVRDALLRHGWVLNGDLQHVVDPGAAHNEQYWKARFDGVLRFLFPAS